MNKNQNIAMGISLAVVAIMVGSAEIFGEKEIIFPEITAVAMGALIAPVQSWNTSRTRLFAAIVSAAVAGVCIAAGAPSPPAPPALRRVLWRYRYAAAVRLTYPGLTF